MKSTLLFVLLLLTKFLMAQTTSNLPKAIKDDQPTVDQKYFRTDTACLQGHISGYALNSEKESALISLHNAITSESSPIVVNIHPDGKFKCKFLINYPIESTLCLNEENIPFYIEPGETLTLLIKQGSIAENDHITYTGSSANINQMLNKANNLLDYNQGGEVHKTRTPAQFKEQLQPLFHLWEQRVDSLIAANEYSEKAVRLIRNKLSLKKGTTLLDFLATRNYHASKDSTNSILRIQEDDSYYDFLKEMPLDDETTLTSKEFRIFINRFEYMQPLYKETSLQKTYKVQQSSQDTIKESHMMRQQRIRQNQSDIINRLCGVPAPLAWQIAGIRHLSNILKFIGNRDLAFDHFTYLKQNLHHPFLLLEAERIFNKAQTEKIISSYELPTGSATTIFRKIIQPHQGKVLFVDFWATSCGGCRLGIEQTAELRKKYKNHPEFQFIYITSETSSPLRTYTKYIEQNLAGEASYRVNRTEFNYLMELFHFSGIPHYVLIEKDGSVSTQNVGTFNLASYLENRFEKNK